MEKIKQLLEGKTIKDPDGLHEYFIKENNK